MESLDNTIFDDLTMTAGSFIQNTQRNNQQLIKTQEDSLFI